MKNIQSDFRRAFILVASIHVILILGVILFLSQAHKIPPENVTWINTESFSSTTSLLAANKRAMDSAPMTEEKPQTQKPEKEVYEAKSEADLKLSPVELPQLPREEKTIPLPSTNQSEIPLSAPPRTATPLPKPMIRPSLNKTAKPPSSSKSKDETLLAHKASPQSRPRPTPQATAKITPREKQTVKNSLSKKESPLHNSREVAAHEKTERKSKSLSSTTDHDSSAKAAFLKAKKEGSNNPSTSNSTGNGTGIDHDALSAYHELIHDRFYSQWEQPTSIPTEHKHDFVCTLQLTIQADGTISHFQLAKASGNPIMDSSVLSAAEKVLTIAPLPSAIATGSSYKVNINFELE